MSNNNHKSLFGKGYYIALILCVAAIGVTGLWYYGNTDRPETDVQAVATEDISAGVTQPQASQSLGGEKTEPTEETAPATEKKSLKTGAPVSGDTVAGYAVDCLSYNETTRDWRTHAGIDIAAEAGTPVLAAAEGVVYNVYEDDTMGITVVLRHEDGYVTQYASLSAAQVSAGDTVALGQQIGQAGSTALLETAIGDHVHFSVTCQGQPVDPAEFLAME